MFKSKGAMFGVAAAFVAAALLLAGTAVSTTSGAPTDGLSTDVATGIGGGPSNLPDSLSPGNPPASPVEPPTNPTAPTTGNPAANDGTPGAATGAPGDASGLPNAGFGDSGQSNGFGALIVLLGLAGAGMLSAGATAATATRRS